MNENMNCIRIVLLLHYAIYKYTTRTRTREREIERRNPNQISMPTHECVERIQVTENIVEASERNVQ